VEIQAVDHQFLDQLGEDLHRRGVEVRGHRLLLVQKPETSHNSDRIANAARQSSGSLARRETARSMRSSAHPALRTSGARSNKGHMTDGDLLRHVQPSQGVVWQPGDGLRQDQRLRVGAHGSLVDFCRDVAQSCECMDWL
jgi:hypothetical protein